MKNEKINSFDFQGFLVRNPDFFDKILFASEGLVPVSRLKRNTPPSFLRKLLLPTVQN